MRHNSGRVNILMLVLFVKVHKRLADLVNRPNSFIFHLEINYIRMTWEPPS